MECELEGVVAGYHLEDLAASLLEVRVAPMSGVGSVIQDASRQAARQQIDEFRFRFQEIPGRARWRRREAKRAEQFRAQQNRRSNVNLEFRAQLVIPGGFR